jgi:hypothetical protein
MRSLKVWVSELDARFAAAMLAVPLAACGGSTNDPKDGSADGTLDQFTTGCPTSQPGCGCPPPTTITYVACDLDASSDASDDGGDAGCFTSCGQACIAQNQAGSICTEQGTDGGLHVASCSRGCGVGRRPDGLCDEPASAGVGGYLAHAAWLEAASVRAFARLARELEAHGAPRWLVREAKRAARDEVRHARAMARLARERGARIPRVRVRAGRVRSLERIAHENAVEGCVGETFGALVARFQAEHAAFAPFRRAMKRIAPDEARHAALSLAVDAWIQPRLAETARAQVANARRMAEKAIAAEIPTTLAELGLPARSQAEALATALFC